MKNIDEGRSKRRRARTRDQWGELIGAWRRSGMSAPKFAAQNDVAACSLWHWARVLGTEESPRDVATTQQGRSRKAEKNDAEVGFVELSNPVVTPRGGPAVAADGVIEVELPGGFVLRLRGAICEQALARTVSVLMEASRC